MPAHPHCGRCQRLLQYRRALRKSYPQYHNAPVQAWGTAPAALLIVGLAPGLHGANASGRPFTGDASGALLFQVLMQTGYAQRMPATQPNEWQLLDCRITNAVKCVPPQNRPLTQEVNRCGRYLREDIALTEPQVIVALGRIAHDALLKTFGLSLSGHRFAHGAEHALPAQRRLIDSYHCSRYNQQTGRIDAEKLADIFNKTRYLIK